MADAEAAERAAPEGVGGDTSTTITETNVGGGMAGTGGDDRDAAAETPARVAPTGSPARGEAAASASAGGEAAARDVEAVRVQQSPAGQCQWPGQLEQPPGAPPSLRGSSSRRRKLKGQA